MSNILGLEVTDCTHQLRHVNPTQLFGYASELAAPVLFLLFSNYFY